MKEEMWLTQFITQIFIPRLFVCSASWSSVTQCNECVLFLILDHQEHEAESLPALRRCNEPRSQYAENACG